MHMITNYIIIFDLSQKNCFSPKKRSNVIISAGPLGTTLTYPGQTALMLRLWWPLY